RSNQYRSVLVCGKRNESPTTATRFAMYFFLRTNSCRAFYWFCLLRLGKSGAATVAVGMLCLQARFNLDTIRGKAGMAEIGSFLERSWRCYKNGEIHSNTERASLIIVI